MAKDNHRGWRLPQRKPITEAVLDRAMAAHPTAEHTQTGQAGAEQREARRLRHVDVEDRRCPVLAANADSKN